jgi:hypothetical protein
MSLNKTLDRLFDEIRREARRNPAFADRLDAVLRLHDSRRDVPNEVAEEVAGVDPMSSPASGGSVASGARDEGGPGVQTPDDSARVAPSVSSADSSPARGGAKRRRPASPTLNPAGLYKKEGEAALTSALAGHDLEALRALVAEHNLDPGGVTPSFTRDELAAHIVAQAKRRAERDEKMFDY